MEPLPYWFASLGNISSSALICPIYFDGSIRLWILYYIYVFSDGESTEETLQQGFFDLWYIFHEPSITIIRSLYLSFATYPTSLVSHLGVPNDYFLPTMAYSMLNHIIVDYLWTRSGTSFNLFLFIKNKPLFISSEGFSEGNAADPVGCDSPLQLVMAVWHTFF